jgi:LCP family protein required for cell wall assembly
VSRKTHVSRSREYALKKRGLFGSLRANRGNARTFLLIVGTALLVSVAVAFAATISLLAEDTRVYSNANPYNPGSAVRPAPPAGTPAPNGAKPNETPPPDGGLLKPPAKTNVLVLGTDNSGGLADVIMAVCFERDTGLIKILSIPRDTYTKLPDERLRSMRANGLYPPTTGVMKLNALRVYGKQYGVQYMQEQLGEMLGVYFDYYVEVNTKAFRALVDLVGGVELEVPKGGLHYEDPYQTPPLSISLEEGMQRLDGAKAEQLVRFRGYPQGDLTRVAVQQQFIKQLLSQALRRENIMSDPLGYVNVALTHVKTDAGAAVVKYVPYAASLSADSVRAYTLPGDAAYINGAAYFLPNAKEIPDLVNEVFYADTSAKKEEKPPAQRTERLSGQNGTDTAGLASSFADILREDGWNVAKIGTYTGAHETRTRVLVREQGAGAELTQYFNDAVIQVSPRNIPGDCDIVIIIGTGER